MEIDKVVAIERLLAEIRTIPTRIGEHQALTIEPAHRDPVADARVPLPPTDQQWLFARAGGDVIEGHRIGVASGKSEAIAQESRDGRAARIEQPQLRRDQVRDHDRLQCLLRDVFPKTLQTPERRADGT